MKDRPFIGAVGEEFLQERIKAEQDSEEREPAVAVLHVGGGDEAGEKEPLSVDQNMALLALDQLARIEAVRVRARPPFSALFTLWLSMIAAVGLGFRSAFSRHLT